MKRATDCSKDSEPPPVPSPRIRKEATLFGLRDTVSPEVTAVSCSIETTPLARSPSWLTAVTVRGTSCTLSERFRAVTTT